MSAASHGASAQSALASRTVPAVPTTSQPAAARQDSRSMATSGSSSMTIIRLPARLWSSSRRSRAVASAVGAMTARPRRGRTCSGSGRVKVPLMPSAP